jgi:hypothetical protein
MYDSLPHGVFRILESYVRALRGAQRLVYLENQSCGRRRSSTMNVVTDDPQLVRDTRERLWAEHLARSRRTG